MPSTIPKKMIGRETEHDAIKKYLKQIISCGGQGNPLYIAGMPGTGKTATARQIINELKMLTTRNSGKRGTVTQITKKLKGLTVTNCGQELLPDFKFIEINVMKLPTPMHIYKELGKQILGKNVKSIFLDDVCRMHKYCLFVAILTECSSKISTVF